MLYSNGGGRPEPGLSFLVVGGRKRSTLPNPNLSELPLLDDGDRYLLRFFTRNGLDFSQAVVQPIAQKYLGR